MDNFYIHNAIRSLYSNVVTIMGEESFDENNNFTKLISIVLIQSE